MSKTRSEVAMDWLRGMAVLTLLAGLAAAGCGDPNTDEDGGYSAAPKSEPKEEPKADPPAKPMTKRESIESSINGYNLNRAVSKVIAASGIGSPQCKTFDLVAMLISV